MWNFIKNCLKDYPDSTIIDETQLIYYDNLFNTVAQHGEALKSVLPPKSKCAVLCNSWLNTAIGLLACWYAGMVAIPLSKNYGEKHCSEILALTNPNIIITDCNLEYEYTYNISLLMFSGDIPKIEVDQSLYDVALIMCTSGTTGKPKGAMITEEGLIKNVEAIAQYFDIGHTDTILIARPAYHCAVLTGEFLISLFKGVNIVFYDMVYDPMNVIGCAEKHHITTICGTPTLLGHISRFLKRSHKALEIKKIAISGECLNKITAENIRSAFPDADIYNVYGLTEASPRVSYLFPSQFDHYPESVGLPLCGVSIKIVDETTGEEVPDCTKGIVMVSSPSLMKGYYKNSELTDLVIKRGWLSTRDIGYKDERGYLYILSRADDMIIKAGMNIYPKEIENAIYSLPEIAECLAYGEKSESGENIGVDVVLNDINTEIDIKVLLTRFHGILPAYLMPSKVNIVKSLPRNASGKIVRCRGNGNE